MTGFSALQRLARRPPPEERCELCGSAIPAGHEHLLEVEKRRLACACQACAILFSGPSQRYRRISTRPRYLADFRLSEAQWQSLAVPINMAFFYREGASGKVVAMFPSPAGATESHLPVEMWADIAAQNPELEAIEPDVEALLVNRLGEQRGFPEHQYFLLPIDECFRLVGIVRMHWRGFSGGEELWRQITEFFDGVRHA